MYNGKVDMWVDDECDDGLKDYADLKREMKKKLYV